MKNFNKFTEQLLLTITPQSDSVGSVTPHEEEEPKDMFSQTSDTIMKNLGGGDENEEEIIQPDDNVGETGEIESSSNPNVELEDMGESGLKVKFNGLEIVLPKDVVDSIKGFENSESEETEENEESETEESEEGEETEESEDNEEVEETEEDDEKKDTPFTDSVRYVQKLLEAKKNKSGKPWENFKNKSKKDKDSKDKNSEMPFKKKNKKD